jgi:hypothetical protein
MRAFAIASVIIATVFCCPINLIAQTEMKFDRFKNVTHISSQRTQTGRVTYDGGKDASLLIRRMVMVISFDCPGQVESCTPKSVQLFFVAYTSDWVMSGRHTVNLLLDGKPEAAGDADWDGQVLDAEDLAEYNGLSVSPALLAKMADAKAVDVQIGVFEFSLTDSNLASIRDAAGHAGWVPETLRQSIELNSEASKSSPAAAAALADVGHMQTPQEIAALVEAGKASKCAVVTNPPGAEIDLDGNRLGVSPVAFVLLRHGDTPRIITIRMSGYKTVEKRVVPDGHIIPIGVTLEAEPK